MYFKLNPLKAQARRREARSHAVKDFGKRLRSPAFSCLSDSDLRPLLPSTTVSAPKVNWTVVPFSVWNHAHRVAATSFLMALASAISADLRFCQPDRRRHKELAPFDHEREPNEECNAYSTFFGLVFC